MNIEGANKTQAITVKSESQELKRSDLSIANSVTTTYASGAIVFEKVKEGPKGFYIKVSIENDQGWKKQIGMLAQYHSGKVGVVEQPQEFRVNGNLVRLSDYYQSL